MAVTLMELVNAVSDTLETAEGLKDAWSQGRAEIKEIPPPGDLPLISVYMATGETSRESENDRKTFPSVNSPFSPIRHFNSEIYVDVYARQRSYIEEDMRAALVVANAVYDVLDTQNKFPFFGHVAIKHFHFTMQLVNFTYAETQFSGYRFIVEISVF